MSDAPKHKKGLRTFAGDFARLKENQTEEESKQHTTPSVPRPDKKEKHSSDHKTKKADAIPKPPKHKQEEKIEQETSAKHQTDTKKSDKKKQPATPPPPTKILAFHELQKSVKSIDTTKKEAAEDRVTSIKDKSGITPERTVGGGTIIRDTKKVSGPREGLFAGIIHWFENYKKKRKKAAHTFAVPETSRRKGVIQEATTKTGTIFTADNETLKERIRNRARDHHSNEDDHETLWSPYTDVGYPLLESGEEDPVTPATPKNVEVTFKKHSKPEPTKVVEPEAPVEPTKEIPVDKPAEVVAPEPAAPEPVTTPEPVIEVEPIAAAEPKVPVADLQDTTTQEPQMILPDPDYGPGNSAPQTLSTNRLTLISVGAILGLILTIAIGWYIVQIFTGTDNEENTPQSLVLQSEIVLLQVDQSFNADSLINTATNSQLPIVEYVLQNVDGEVLPTAVVLEFVAPDFSSTIEQLATDIRFISINQSEPQILLEITDSISVKGALLMQEDEIATALIPLFGEVSDGRFIDDTINNTDVRILTDSEGEDQLVYGFLNDQTVVIANSVQNFTAIITSAN